MGNRSIALPEKEQALARADKKIKLLALLGEGYSVTYSAKEAGISVRTVYDWKAKDADFATALKAAYEEGGDWYEDKLSSQADDGNTTATIVGLKMHKRFIEKQQTEHTGEVVLKVVYGDG